jgi:acetyltransferase-like isoleucine patch superfamily enzyme
MRSGTWRKILRERHGVEVGAFSYGGLIDSGGFHRGTRIGRYCSFGEGLRVVRRNHPMGAISTHPLFYDDAFGLVSGLEVNRDELNPLEIGHDVWLGVGVTILPGCRRIGHGAVVGAASVVTSDVPDFAIVAGVPARPIRLRFDEPTRARLHAIAWWERPLADLAPIAHAFASGDLETVSRGLPRR